ncbi:MAG: UDP-2,3-diacylglucosamine diphosphatase, partial [Burkholderiaceae bacterium]
EYWAGDDDLPLPFHRRVAAALRTVRDAGVDLFWIGGNRDFLVGEAFAEAVGATRLPDPFVAAIAGRPIVLTHGDALCTDDVEYMRFRAMVRQPAWQQAFLAKPLTERKAIVEGLRERSETDKKTKSMAIMDVNPEAVERMFDAAGTSVLIHGHTHRPGRHCLGTAESPRWRYVLPDWEGDRSPVRGGWLGIDARGEMHRFDAFGLPAAFDCAG